MTNVPSVVYDMPAAEYFAAPGLSHSGSKLLRKSALHYHAFKVPEAPPQGDPSPQMLNGTLVHCAVLEPNQFDARYPVGPAVSKNSNEWKRFAEGAKAAGQTPISEEQRERAWAQARAVSALPDVADLLRDCRTEVSVWWVCPRTRVLCKGRIDAVAVRGRNDLAILLDLKTTGEADPKGFSKSIGNFGYHTQSDWYAEGYSIAAGIEVDHMLLAAVESEYPFAAAAYQLDRYALEVARQENDNARNRYRACMQADEWPGYPQAVQRISLPYYY